MILEPIDGGAAVVGESAHHRSQASVMVIGERVGHDCIRIDGDVLGRLGFRPDAAKALCYGRSASQAAVLLEANDGKPQLGSATGCHGARCSRAYNYDIGLLRRNGVVSWSLLICAGAGQSALICRCLR